MQDSEVHSRCRVYIGTGMPVGGRILKGSEAHEVGEVDVGVVAQTTLSRVDPHGQIDLGPYPVATTTHQRAEGAICPRASALDYQQTQEEMPP